MTADTYSSPTNHTKEPFVGKVLPERPFAVTDALIDDYFDGLQLDRSPFDRGETPVPSMVARSADDYFSETRFQQDKGHLWMRQEWAFYRPLQRGAIYSAHAEIVDIYTRRDRTVVDTAVSLVDQSGTIVLTSNHHQSFLLTPPAELVSFRDPAKKEGARKFSVPDGVPLQPIERTITLEMCGQYFHGSKSYHTDLKASQQLGFQDVVVGGAMTMSYAGQLLETYFGPSWWTSGRLDLKFTNPAWPGDNIRVKGVATGLLADAPARDGAFAWIEKDDGTIVLIATASAER